LLKSRDKKTSASARRISTNTGVQRATYTLPPFEGQHFRRLVVCFYLTYSKLLGLKLTAARRMQVCTKNSRFSMNVWSITAECSRLITFGRPS